MGGETTFAPLNVHGINNVREMEIHIAEPSLPHLVLIKWRLLLKI
jgi:hypothetical protein